MNDASLDTPREDAGSNIQIVRLIAVANMAVAVLFFLFFSFTKHEPAIAMVNPFAEDPYDAVGSFGIQLSGFCALLALVRAFRSRGMGQADLVRQVLVLRSVAVSLFAVIITTAADMAAMARFSSLWFGSSAGRTLLSLVLFQFSLASLLTFDVLRRVKQGGVLSPPVSWGAGFFVLSVCCGALACYPQHLREGVAGAVFTAIIGTVFLFLLAAAMTGLLFVRTNLQGPDLLDELETMYESLKSHLRFPLRQPLVLDSARNPRLIRRIFEFLNPRMHKWRLPIILALTLGVLLASAELSVEGLSPEFDKALTVIAVFVALEAAGVLLGFVLFRRFLCISHTQ